MHNAHVQVSGVHKVHSTYHPSIHCNPKNVNFGLWHICQKLPIFYNIWRKWKLLCYLAVSSANALDWPESATAEQMHITIINKSLQYTYSMADQEFPFKYISFKYLTIWTAQSTKYLWATAQTNNQPQDVLYNERNVSCYWTPHKCWQYLSRCVSLRYSIFFPSVV